MKVIIDISEDDYRFYEKFHKENYYPKSIFSRAYTSIANGTPLPKGHGRLKDADKVLKEMLEYRDDCAKTSEYTRLGFETAIAVVEDAKTIIESDKGIS